MNKCFAPRIGVCSMRESDLPAGKARTPAEAAAYAREVIGDEASEHYLVLLLNRARCVVGTYELTAGSSGFVAVDPSGVMRAALHSGARSIVAVHNHPSGDPHPSGDDRDLSIRLGKAAEILGIKFDAHLVVGQDGFSMIEQGGRIPECSYSSEQAGPKECYRAFPRSRTLIRRRR